MNIVKLYNAKPKHKHARRYYSLIEKRIYDLHHRQFSQDRYLRAIIYEKVNNNWGMEVLYVYNQTDYEYAQGQA